MLIKQAFSSLCYRAGGGGTCRDFGLSSPGPKTKSKGGGEEWAEKWSAFLLFDGEIRSIGWGQALSAGQALELHDPSLF